MATFGNSSAGRSIHASMYGDVERPHAWMEKARREGDRRTLTHWRQTLTVSAAGRRARAGDRTAARRLAWRLLVIRRRRRADWLVSRYKAAATELARLQRGLSHPDCAACFLRATRVRGRREEYLSAIAQLPGSVPTYDASPHLDFLALAEGDYWFRKELEDLGKGLDGGGA